MMYATIIMVPQRHIVAANSPEDACDQSVRYWEHLAGSPVPKPYIWACEPIPDNTRVARGAKATEAIEAAKTKRKERT